MPTQTEQDTSQYATAEPNKYQLRLESIQKVAGYGDLSDESKQTIALLAFDTELNFDDFNHAAGIELGVVTVDANLRSAMVHTAFDAMNDHPEGESTLNLPQTFSEAAHTKGHSIEDFVKTIDFEALNGASDALERNYSATLTPEDAAFLGDPQNILQHDAQLRQFVDTRITRNPYQSERTVQSQQFGWLQLDSRDFVKSRIEDKSTDVPSARIYMNPSLGNVMSIYQEIFEKAEAQGLRFKSKVLDFELHRLSAEQQQKTFDFYSQATTRRTDPILFYAFEDSKDELLEIANEVYRKYSGAFEGQVVAAFPQEIAPGYGVGAEPDGLTGVESLSSHRQEVIGTLIHKLSAFPEWATLTNQQKQKTVAANFRRLIAPRQHINADNIAFNA